jgi:hypothetical protein
VRVRRGGDGGDVVDQQPRVGRRFQPDQPRRRAERRGQGGFVSEIHLPDATALPVEHAVEDAVGPAVDVEADDDLVPGLQPRLQHGILGGQP